MLRTGRSGWSRCCATRCWSGRSEQLGNGAVARYAAEVAEHKRDPYSLVEEIVNTLGKKMRWRTGVRPSSTSGTLAPTLRRRSLMFSIDHLGVAVKSLAAAKGIYEKLGLKRLARRNRRSRAGAGGDGAAGREPAGTAGADLGKLGHREIHRQAGRRIAPRLACACPTWRPRSSG